MKPKTKGLKMQYFIPLNINKIALSSDVVYTLQTCIAKHRINYSPKEHLR